MNGPSLYMQKIDDLIAAREAKGGTLPVQEESDFCETLDGIWWGLTNAEQIVCEEEIEARKKDGRYTFATEAEKEKSRRGDGVPPTTLAALANPPPERSGE